MVFDIYFTLDYEIHGNGDGDPLELMVKPTDRLLKILNSFGAKLTIMPDVAEIMKFSEYLESTGIDRFHFLKIVEQLQHSFLTGHDVQLHLHSSYFNSFYDGLRWSQCWSDYDLASLPYEKVYNYVKSGKEFLDVLIGQVDPSYDCFVFRAANWSMMPSTNIIKALVKNGILIDTSVYKWGVQIDNVRYDYSNAHSNIMPYKVDNDNINLHNPQGRLVEYPIYCEKKYFYEFITPIRIFRFLRSKLHKHNRPHDPARPSSPKDLSFGSFFRLHPWKLDFNQASGDQMIFTVKKLIKTMCDLQIERVPIVLIGHSKSFIKYNEATLGKFLDYCSKNGDINFAKFKKP